MSKSSRRNAYPSSLCGIFPPLPRADELQEDGDLEYKSDHAADQHVSDDEAKGQARWDQGDESQQEKPCKSLETCAEGVDDNRVDAASEDSP
jgi:hypothetical protein